MKNISNQIVHLDDQLYKNFINSKMNILKIYENLYEYLFDHVEENYIKNYMNTRRTFIQKNR